MAWLCDAQVHVLKDDSKKSTSNLKWVQVGVWPKTGKPRWQATCVPCQAPAGLPSGQRKAKDLPT